MMLARDQTKSGLGHPSGAGAAKIRALAVIGMTMHSLNLSRLFWGLFLSWDVEETADD